MTILTETAEQFYVRLMSELAPKARSSLERVRLACDGIETVRGTMNYSRVAAAATERFGGPRKQTIQNNRQLKAYIARRIHEYTNRSTRSRADQPVTSRTKPSQYPSQDLDSKTRLHIDLLTADNRRLHDENVYLANLLEQQTTLQPISISDAIKGGPSTDLTLQIPMAGGSDLPVSVRELLKLLIEGRNEQLYIQSRANSTRLAIVKDGMEHVLLTPAQWNEAIAWMKEVQSFGNPDR